MPQSLAQILVHLVFSTKNREPWLTDDIRDELHGYIAGIVENQKGNLLKVGSVADHVHLFIAHPRTCAPAELVQEIKTGTSKWLKNQRSALRWVSLAGWLRDIFGEPDASTGVEKYIVTQAERHRTVTFQEEFRRLLHKYGISFEERYVWD